MQPSAGEQRGEGEDQAAVAARAEEDLAPEPGGDQQDGADDADPGREHDQPCRHIAGGLARLVGLRVGHITRDAEVDSDHRDRHQQREGAARQRVLAEALRPGEERDQPEREQVAADDEALGHEGREVVEAPHAGTGSFSSTSSRRSARRGMLWCSIR